ncbi:hypothetical protein Tco_1497478, partial [Tanacetum coccineum]
SRKPQRVEPVEREQAEPERLAEREPKEHAERERPAEREPEEREHMAYEI